MALPATAAGGASSGQTSHADVSTQGGLLSWVMWAPTVLCDMAGVPQIWWPQVNDHAFLPGSLRHHPQVQKPDPSPHLFLNLKITLRNKHLFNKCDSPGSQEARFLLQACARPMCL